MRVRYGNSIVLILTSLYCPFRDTALFTVRNSGCGEVMFSQACVKNSVHGGGHLPPGLGERCPPLGPEGSTHPSQADTPLGRHSPGRHPLR